MLYVTVTNWLKQLLKGGFDNERPLGEGKKFHCILIPCQMLEESVTI